MNPPAGVLTARSIEAKMEGFAEDLGRLLGTARAKAEGWIGQRQNIAKQLADIRDTAADLLSKLTGGGARVASAVGGARRGRPGRRRRKAGATDGAGSARSHKRRKMSAAARAAISRAQKVRWRKQKAETKSGG